MRFSLRKTIQNIGDLETHISEQPSNQCSADEKHRVVIA